MSNKSIRLGSTLTFDEEQERDIIEFIERLNSSHKTGQFLSNLIRVAMDCPEVLAKVNGEYEIGPAIGQLDTIGMSVSRKRFMTQVSRDIAVMKDKVDEVYKQATKVYMLAQVGKRLGIEDRTDSILMATFVCQKQLNQLQEKMGVMFKNDPYISEKLDSAHKMADEALEYILDSYSNIMTELKNNMQVQTLNIPVNPLNIPVNPVNVPVNTVNIPVDKLSIPVETLTIPVQTVGVASIPQENAVNTQSESNNKNSEVVENDNSDDDEIVDFGESADLGALGNFFGD